MKYFGIRTLAAGVAVLAIGAGAAPALGAGIPLESATNSSATEVNGTTVDSGSSKSLSELLLSGSTGKKCPPASTC
ncbi:hypothetical protein NDR87_22560 [Nocardia sp. CDC159]|uniref:Secreted protein n=1 Tax=Nocardia pulmonis TaxID=2951408 RepID=A0A9X2EEE0_9NOCA|nr:MULTISPECIES: hypothetical protein [Nocardia]MCM6776698.1 hypothetical protein [Nocardia pulmonis]MCM6789153.1 hypothetical protein [Nocardia sp. CDC159]